MRHAGSLLLSLFLAPLIWVGTGYGLNEVNRARAQLVGGFEIEIVLGMLALLAAGGLYALLTMARLSPIGPALIGLIFLALATWSAFDPDSYFDTMPTDLRDGDFALTYPALGYSALLAVPLLATLLSPRRWRRYAVPAAATPAAPAYAMPAAGMPPGAVQPGGAYAPPYGGQPTFAATPGYLVPPPAPGAPQPGGFGEPAPTAQFPVPQAPTSSPPAPTSVPPAPAAPVAAPTHRIPVQTPPPPAEQDTTTRLSQPPPEAPTTRIPMSPTAAVPFATQPAPPAEAPTTRIPTSPTTAVPAATPPVGDQTTTRMGTPDTEATQLLKGPPPKDAYPRPAWSAPTPPPITPPGARKPEDDLDDPEATQPSR
jgi:hypothetical protein